jgi:hypothetical protein
MMTSTFQRYVTKRAECHADAGATVLRKMSRSPVDVGGPGIVARFGLTPVRAFQLAHDPEKVETGFPSEKTRSVCPAGYAS